MVPVTGLSAGVPGWHSPPGRARSAVPGQPEQRSPARIGQGLPLKSFASATVMNEN